MNDQINLLHPDVRANPYPIYAELRRRPICRVEPGSIWAISRYDDVLFVLKNPGFFSSAAFQAMLKPPWLPHNPVGDSILVMDPPQHSRLRALASGAFAGSSMARLEPLIRTIAAQHAGRLHALGQADFVAEFATPFPAQVIGEILGLEPPLHPRLKGWTQDLVSISPAPPSEQFEASARKTVADMEHFLRASIELRRIEPRDDVVSMLVHTELSGEKLTESEVMAFLFLLLPAGFETTTNLLANSMLHLADRPDTTASLRADPGLIPKFVEEVMRYDPPVHTLMRLATQDVDIGGVTVPQGSVVAVLLGSANRDEAHFPEPERFNLDRSTQGAVMFGHGIHSCLGAALARMEARVGLGALLARFQGFLRVPSPIEWISSLTVRRPTALPLRLVPA